MWHACGPSHTFWALGGLRPPRVGEVPWTGHAAAGTIIATGGGMLKGLDDLVESSTPAAAVRVQDAVVVAAPDGRLYGRSRPDAVAGEIEGFPKASIPPLHSSNQWSTVVGIGLSGSLWMRAMLGHAVCNVVPVVAANRIGNEEGQKFYGTSFICDHRGELLTQGAIDQPEILMAQLDLTQTALDRASFGFFRDRRPEFYGALTESA